MLVHGLELRPGQDQETQEEPARAHGVERPDGQELEGVAGAGNQTRLETPRGAHEDDPGLGIAGEEGQAQAFEVLGLEVAASPGACRPAKAPIFP